MNKIIDATSFKTTRVCVFAIAAFVAICCYVVTASAVDITTVQGRVYTDVQVRRIEPDGISIKHACGIDKIFFRELTPEDRDRFHLDASSAAAYSEVQRQSVEAVRKRQEAVARKEAAEWEKRDAQRKIEENRRKAQAELQAMWSRSAREYVLYCDSSYRSGEVNCHGTNRVEYVIYGYSTMPKQWFRVRAVSLGRVQTGPSTTAIQLMLDPSRYPLELSPYDK